MEVIRKTLNGSSEAFSFDNYGAKFLVKNFSDNDCYVNFDEITLDNKDNSIKIASGMSEIILDNEFSPQGYKIIYILGTGDVEVQIVLNLERPAGCENVMIGQNYISKL